MASSATRIFLRLAFLLVLLFVAFYIGRPLYWKLSATVHEIRENRQTVKQGISQLVLDAQRTVGLGWVHDESDSGHGDDSRARKLGTATSRRILETLYPNPN